MALFVWRGDARGRAHVAAVTAEFVEAGDVVTLTINRKEVSFTALGTTLVPLYEGLAAAIEAADLPELAEVTAEVMTDAAPPYLKLTGAPNGRPLIVAANAANGSIGDVNIATTTSAFSGANEKQQIALPSGVTGGTFTLTFDGQTTSTVAYNANAATVQAALEALSNIDSGDIEVSGSAGGPWSIEFKQAFSHSDVALLTMDATSLTAGAVSITELVKGSAGTNEKIRVTMVRSAAMPYGTITQYAMTFGVGNVIFLDKDFSELDTAAKFQTAMYEASSTVVNSTNVAVSLVSSSFNQRVYDIEFLGSLGGTNWNISFSEATSWGIDSSVTTLQNGSASGNNEVQTVSLLGAPSGGTFTLTYNGQTTSGIAYNAAASAVQSALEALSNVGSGDVAVIGTAPNWSIEFKAALGAQDISPLTGSGASLTGGAGTIDTTQSAAAPINEKQTISLSAGVTGGTFTLSYSGQSSGNISYAAAASSVKSALESLSNIDAVAVTGPSGGPWIVEFQGALAATNVAMMVGDGSNLTGDNSQTLTVTTLVTATGPHHWNEAANWDQNSVPVTGGDVRIENSASDILFGLDQSAVSLLSLDIRASYTGLIGLPNVNPGGYHEYLPTHLAIAATTVRIGDGEGSGSPLIRLDNGSVETAVTVYNTGSPTSANGYAVEWIGAHINNTLTVYKGTVGVAVGGGEEANLAALRVSFVNSRQADALVYLGDHVSVGNIRKNGGELNIAGRSGADISSIQSSAGDLFLRGSDGVAALTVEGGDFYYWSTGTLSGEAIVSGDGRLIFDGDLREKQVAGAINVYGDSASVIDTAEVVNANGLLSLHYQRTSRFADLGSDLIISRGMPAESEAEMSTTLFAAAIGMIEVAVDSDLESIAAMLTTASYLHPAGKAESDIIQIDLISPTEAVTLHDATNDTDGQVIAADATEYIPVTGAAVTALRLVTDSSATVLVKIYYK